MSVEQKKVTLQAVDKALIEGDFSTWDEQSRLEHLKRVCDSVGLNPLTKPFEFIKLNGKTQLYARKDATDQLRFVHHVDIFKIEEKLEHDTFRVIAHARLPNGRTDCDIGVVSIKGLAGDALANSQMKAFTKAKRRVTLSICGLGILDESELETISDAQPLNIALSPTKTGSSIVSTTLLSAGSGSDVTPKPTMIGAKVEQVKNVISTTPSNYSYPGDEIKVLAQEEVVATPTQLAERKPDPLNKQIFFNDCKRRLGEVATLSALQQVFSEVTKEVRIYKDMSLLNAIIKFKDECKEKLSVPNKEC